MKNDLKELNVKEDSIEASKLTDDEYKVTRLDKIRNSIYYVVARAIKFGLESHYLLTECNLT